MRGACWIPLFFLLSVVVPARGQQPLYIVNGVERTDMREIDPEIIERMEELPADEFTIAQYGERAANGVVIITLKYDEPARFVADTVGFARYIARQIKWGPPIRRRALSSAIALPRMALSHLSRHCKRPTVASNDVSRRPLRSRHAGSPPARPEKPLLPKGRCRFSSPRGVLCPANWSW